MNADAKAIRNRIRVNVVAAISAVTVLGGCSTTAPNATARNARSEVPLDVKRATEDREARERAEKGKEDHWLLNCFAEGARALVNSL